MPAERTTMRHMRETLRLKLVGGLATRPLGAACKRDWSRWNYPSNSTLLVCVFIESCSFAAAQRGFHV